MKIKYVSIMKQICEIFLRTTPNKGVFIKKPPLNKDLLWYETNMYLSLRCSDNHW